MLPLQDLSLDGKKKQASSDSGNSVISKIKGEKKEEISMAHGMSSVNIIKDMFTI